VASDAATSRPPPPVVPATEAEGRRSTAEGRRSGAASSGHPGGRGRGGAGGGDISADWYCIKQWLTEGGAFES